MEDNPPQKKREPRLSLLYFLPVGIFATCRVYATNYAIMHVAKQHIARLLQNIATTSYHICRADISLVRRTNICYLSVGRDKLRNIPQSGMQSAKQTGGRGDFEQKFSLVPRRRIYIRREGTNGNSKPKYDKNFVVYEGNVLVYQKKQKESIEHVYTSLWFAIMSKCTVLRCGGRF